MTRDRLNREIASLEIRLAETVNPITPQEKRAHTRVRNALNRRRRMLISLEKTGTPANWSDCQL